MSYHSEDEPRPMPVVSCESKLVGDWETALRSRISAEVLERPAFRSPNNGAAVINSDQDNVRRPPGRFLAAVAATVALIGGGLAWLTITAIGDRAEIEATATSTEVTIDGLYLSADSPDESPPFTVTFEFVADVAFEDAPAASVVEGSEPTLIAYFETTEACLSITYSATDLVTSQVVATWEEPSSCGIYHQSRLHELDAFEDRRQYKVTAEIEIARLNDQRSATPDGQLSRTSDTVTADPVVLTSDPFIFTTAPPPNQ